MHHDGKNVAYLKKLGKTIIIDASTRFSSGKEFNCHTTLNFNRNKNTNPAVLNCHSIGGAALRLSSKYPNTKLAKVVVADVSFKNYCPKLYVQC
jgi:hypothetical protein